MDSENLRYLLWGGLIAGLFWLLSLVGGGSRWKRTLRSIGLAAGLGFIVFPDPETGEWGVRHVLTLFAALPDHPYPIGQILAAGLGAAFWCFWLVAIFVLLGFVPERGPDTESSGAPRSLDERREPEFDRGEEAG